MPTAPRNGWRSSRIRMVGRWRSCPRRKWGQSPFPRNWGLSPFSILLVRLLPSPTPAKCDTFPDISRSAIYASLRVRHPREKLMSNASSERVSVFGPTLRFKGELKAQEDLKVEGRIEGTIHHQQRLHVGPKGEVVASVNAAAIDVDGRVQGDMVAKKSIKVSQSAIVRGNIRAPSVSIK